MNPEQRRKINMRQRRAHLINRCSDSDLTPEQQKEKNDRKHAHRLANMTPSHLERIRAWDRRHGQ